MPTISSQLRIASSTVMPEEYIMAKLEAKRDRMILRRIGPISGTRDLVVVDRVADRAGWS